ncbi:uncharacterized protein LOC110714372 [Chenopodium quinoa]|uniref:uncharacterized protein LOC110714372 n=1 Tax=Chenopodium quinoa TaxID=63459 RepID=UPI000B785CA0|nr:uncharacterized protein LOC110714372 [Chenopodium quinoa]
MENTKKLDETQNSTEEQDQLIRSNKKPKRKSTHSIPNPSNGDDEEMADAKNGMNRGNGNPLVPPQLNQKIIQPGGSMSFRDIMQRDKQAEVYSHEINIIDEEEDEEISDDEEIPDEIQNDERCPVIQLSKEEKRRLRKPWKDSLIIKMFSEKLGYMSLMRRLKIKWNIRGELSLTDFGCNYYIARFTNQADYSYVLTQGPWLLNDNYLTIRKWIPNFVPDETPIMMLTAWVRIPNLLVEYFDINFLSKIGSKIRKVLRVGKTTAQAERGQFTRLSVEIDLTKPLLSKFWLKGRIWRVQYEGIKMVCFRCGKLGHSEDACHTSEIVNTEGGMIIHENPLNNRSH